LLEFTERITAKPGAIDAADVERLRRHSFDDAAISSCVQVVAYFNYINRIAEGLGVSGEDWLDDDGRTRSV
jgi:alkylhydroperoxidase family enzyme